jgi:hypothetical protein
MANQSDKLNNNEVECVSKRHVQEKHIKQCNHH